MELKELELIIEEHFYKNFDVADYKLMLLGEDKKNTHLSYMVVCGDTPYVWFRVCDSAIYDATSTEILSSSYDTLAWYHFIKGVRDTLFNMRVGDTKCLVGY